MKLNVYLFTVLVGSTLTYNPKVLELSLQILEHLAATEVGIFQCIFYDASAVNPFSIVLDDLMRSPQLRYAVKTVVYRDYWNDLFPKEPSVLLIYPGEHKDQVNENVYQSFTHFLFLFNPATKVIVFVNYFDGYPEHSTHFQLVSMKFKNVIFIDSYTAKIRVSSLTNVAEVTTVGNPKTLFDWHKRELHGGNITCVSDGISDPTRHWITTTARYLNADVHEYKPQQGGPVEPDIYAEQFLITDTNPALFRRVMITALETCSIMVPRGRPLNAVELMLMPFSWQVWAVLLTILALSEITKHLAPNLFKNDPILLIVCGFERHNLHKAGPTEKIILLSLIIVMFFMSNAFETKIVSLMISKPSIQQIKSLADFDEHGLKFRYDLDVKPHAATHPVIGKYVVHGADNNFATDYVPGFAVYVNHNSLDIRLRLAYDFERGQPFYVALDERYYDGIQAYRTASRSKLTEVFQFTYVALDEAGILGQWQRQSDDEAYNAYWGRRRPRGKLDDETYLNIGDMLPAWMALAIGSCVSLVGFLGELIKKGIEMCLERRRTRKN